jgi:putative transposase
MQTLTVKIRLLPENTKMLSQLSREYCRVVNDLTLQAENKGAFPSVTTKHIDTFLPSAVCNQAIRDAKNVSKKAKKQGKRPILKKPVYCINNQNYTLTDTSIAFPICVEGKTKRIAFEALITARDLHMLDLAKFGLMRVVQKSGKWYAQISIVKETPTVQGEDVMGVDLGLKVPAVLSTSTGKVKFLGNGRQNKYIRRKYKSKRRMLGKLKKLSAIRKAKNKESRWMTDQNHKISRQIVDIAKKEGVSVIKLEKLQGIRMTARTSRKNRIDLHNWTYYQLMLFIAYKASLAGIQVLEVNPKYTSQTCPNCGVRNKAVDRKYVCSCGFSSHRDLVGAINIRRVPVTDGNSLSA